MLVRMEENPQSSDQLAEAMRRLQAAENEFRRARDELAAITARIEPPRQFPAPPPPPPVTSPTINQQRYIPQPTPLHPQSPQHSHSPQQPPYGHTRPPYQPQPFPGAESQPAQGPLLPGKPWWTNEQIIIRILGTLGTIITFAGVGFLVSLGIEKGWLGPITRVVLSALLGFAFLGLSFFFKKRNFHPAAVGATSNAALLVLGATVIALGYIMDLWQPALATSCLIVLIVGFGIITRRWNQEGIAIATGISAFALTMWHFSYHSDLDIQLMPHALAGIMVLYAAYKREWKNAEIVGGVLAVAGALFGDTFSADIDDFGYFILLAMLATVLLKAHPAITIGLYAVLCTFDDPITFGFAVVVCAIWIALAGGYIPWIVLIFNFLPFQFHSPREWEFVVTAAFFICFAAAIAYFKNRPQHPAFWLTWLFLGALMLSGESLAVVSRAITNIPVTSALVVGFSIAVALVVALIYRDVFARQPSPIPLLSAIFGLYYSMIAVGLITGALGGVNGLMLGHALTSLLWIILAAWLLLKQHSSLGIGMMFAIAGILKLLLFDMDTLTGIPRVLAFLLSGAVLIGITVSRGKTTGTKPSAESENPTEAQNADHHTDTDPHAPGTTQLAANDTTYPDTHPDQQSDLDEASPTTPVASRQQPQPWQQAQAAVVNNPYGKEGQPTGVSDTEPQVPTPNSENAAEPEQPISQGEETAVLGDSEPTGADVKIIADGATDPVNSPAAPPIPEPYSGPSSEPTVVIGERNDSDDDEIIDVEIEEDAPDSENRQDSKTASQDDQKAVGVEEEKSVADDTLNSDAESATPATADSATNDDGGADDEGNQGNTESPTVAPKNDSDADDAEKSPKDSGSSK